MFVIVRPFLIAFLVALFVCVLPAAQAVGGWDKLQPGMSKEATVGLLGAPLFFTKGRGYELWVYDQKGDVLFARGRVVAWTAPSLPPSAPVSLLPRLASLKP